MRLELGLFTDRNQKSNLQHALGDSLFSVVERGKSDAVSILSFGYELPFARSDAVTLGNYAEIAHIYDNGMGYILPGVYADFGIVKVNFEYRIHGKQFVSGFFDNFYEEERAQLITLADSTMAIQTKEQSLKDVEPSYGIYSRIEGILGKRFKVMLAWQNMYGEGSVNGKSLWFSTWIDAQFGRLEDLSYSYSKTNVARLSLGKVAVPRAQMSAGATFNLNEKRRWFITAKYSERYKDKDGEIKWWKDTKRSFSVGVRYDY
jgi:hypothetical protein